MGRIYISCDRGAGAWVEAAWDRWDLERGQPFPDVDEVVQWGQAHEYSWSRPGILCPIGADSDGIDCYVCGFPGDPDILVRAWSHILPLLDINPLHWQFVKVSVSAPSIDSWQAFRRSYGRLVKARERG
ncbi:hypothetical protein JOE21_000508 [Desmospora profundinema]|uniref:Uncharacterized protein n=1 Tax=Desmospora profundinema TaxID=1571184 RepID=A0ABU1IIB4_9BACL|nr:hypothetical protein [Desmospora profundinema]